MRGHERARAVLFQHAVQVQKSQQWCKLITESEKWKQQSINVLWSRTGRQVCQTYRIQAIRRNCLCGADVSIKPCHVQKPALYKPAAYGGVDSAVLEPISLSLVTGKPAHNFLNTMTYGSFESQGLHVPWAHTLNVDTKPRALKLLCKMSELFCYL